MGIGFLQVFVLLTTITCCFGSKADYYLLLLPKQFQAIAGYEKSLITNDKAFSQLKDMLKNETNLSKEVIDKTLMILTCATKNSRDHNNILTIIDYSLPSNKKRLWVINLENNKVLFHTYVSHGIKSGTLLSDKFSNRRNSKASSIGVFNTDKSYFGRHGLALKLYGLEKSFNDNAYQRFIVMHGSWYVKEKFIKKYGRAGRSWGCPALPPKLTKPIIETIKDNSLMVVYYPSEKWLLKSKYLNCDEYSNGKVNHVKFYENNSISNVKEVRQNILFFDKNSNSKRETNEPIVVITANSYHQIFNKKVPLNRMLRRQIKNVEYIALSNSEFEYIYNNMHNKDPKLEKMTDEIYLVIPVVKKLRGFYATEMKIIDKIKINKFKLDTVKNNHNNTVELYIMKFNNKPSVKLKLTDKFIRWLGL